MANINQKTFHIVCVDDSATNQQLLNSVLDKHGYKVTSIDDGQKALDYIAANPSVDLILLDIMMPNMDGYTVCQYLKSSPILSRIPVIFLTAYNDIEALTKSFEVGGVDYIIKPFRTKELLIRIQTHLKLKFYQDQELEKTQYELIAMMGSLAESHHSDTARHVERVGEYAALIAKLLGFSEEHASIIKSASMLHDIGKVTTPDCVLNKPEKLTEDEFAIMKQHALAGYHSLSCSTLPLFQVAAIIAHEHHEKYDGSGYPRGLKGEAIHIFGRIVAFADVFDAISSSRSYKKGWPLNEIYSYIKSMRGKHFDPKIVDLFFDNFSLFLDIKEKYEKPL
ncbi:HD domain-containing phosphohydrolase [Sulfuricurvum sp.]|uniref:response regulator n=1 Tax=Sulfuricurvum sp. TaxID=2025608 RepID=UPI00260F0EE5|nr:HD domain-containing phosphohydrolase [Sulfuricurvum sp.]MDD3596532.1 response regulator [Sulfuricurvum sp.]